MEKQNMGPNKCDDDSCNNVKLCINGSKKEILNNMFDDLASNNNTISFNFNTKMLSELSPGPVPEPIIQSLNGFSPITISFDPKIPPPNLTVAVDHNDSMNTIICDSKELLQIEIDPATTALQCHADQLKNLGNDHYMAERYSLARSLYSEAIKLCPNNSTYYRNRSNCSMMLGDFEKGLQDSQMIISLGSESEDGYNCMIKCCLALGDIDNARQAINKLIKLSSNNSICRRYVERCEQLRSLLVMATTSFEKQDIHATVHYVDSALEISPACVMLKQLKARCLMHLGRINDGNAIATSCKISSESKNPKASSVDSKYMAGLSACFKGDLNRGLSYFQEAAELDLDQIKARLMELKTKKRKVKKHDRRDSFQADKILEPCEMHIETFASDHKTTEMFNIGPPDESFNVQLYFNRALVNAKKGNISHAIADCTCTLNNSPDHLKALLLRAKCHNQLLDYVNCVKDYEAALEIERNAEIEQALEKVKLEWKHLAVDKFNAGNEQFKIKNYSSALQLFNEAINLSSKNSEYYCCRSECLIMIGDYKDAIQDGHNTVSLDKKSIKGFECIMKCSLALGDLDGTENAIQNLTEIDPNNEICKEFNDKCKQLRTLVDMAKQCFEKNDFQATVVHVDSALKLATGCLKLKLMKAECFVYIGCVDDGIAMAVSCLEIDPSNVDAFYVVGLCSYYKGDLKDGLSFFQKALDIDSNHEKSKMMLLKAKDLKHKKDEGEKMFEAGKYRVAQKLFTEALEIDSLNITINSMLYLNRAKCHYEVKDLKKCAEDYMASLKLIKNRQIELALKQTNIALNRQAKFRKNTGDKLYRYKKYSAALSMYNKAIELCPENVLYLNSRSECLIMIGDYKDAIRDSHKSISIDKRSKKGYECIIKCSLALGDADGAEVAIKSLTEIDPNSENCNQFQEKCKQLRTLVDMATQCYDKDNFKKSVYHANCALKLAPACVKIKMMKAENLIRLGRFNEANEIVKADMETDPSNADVIYVAGLNAYYKSDLDQGLIYFQETLDVKPDHKKAHTMQVKAKNLKEKKESGDKLFKAGKFHVAHKMYTAALQIDSLNSDFNAKLYFNRALMSSKIGNSLDTIADCTKALDLSPGYLKALLLRGKCHNNINDTIRDYESAMEISKTSEIENALKEAKAALKRQANSKKDAGNQQFRSGNYSSALNLYDEAIRLCPNDAVYHRNKSACLIRMANYTDGLKEARIAVDLDQESEKGYTCILKCYLALGEISSAEATIAKLHENVSNQNMCKPYENQVNELRTSAEMATQTFEKKDFYAAISHIESALKVATACMKYKIMKAECLINVGRVDEANDIAILCMLIDPMNTDAIYVSGLCSYYKSDLDQGLTYFQRALALDPDHFKARIMRFKAKNLKEKKKEGDILFTSGQFRKAYYAYTETLKMDSSNVSFNAKLYFNRALMTSKMALNWKSAIDDTTVALKMNPNYVKAYLLRAKCYNMLDNLKESMNDYSAALKIEKSPETERLLNKVTSKLKSLADNKKDIGDEQYTAGKYSKALSLYNQAIKLFPKYASYYCAKAKCLFAMLSFKEALVQGQRAVALDEKSDIGHDFIMKCSLILGDLLPAKLTMQRLYANDSNNIIYKRHHTNYTKLKYSAEMATQYFEEKNFQVAVPHIDSALEIATACSKFKLLKAECLIYLGRYEEANNIAKVYKLLISDPSAADAVYISGLSAYYKGDLDIGLKDFEQALKMDPDHKKAQTMRLNTKKLKEKKDQGDKLFKAGIYNEAKKMYTEALQINEMSTNFKAKLLFNRALMESKLGNFLSSIDDCTEALSLSPKYLKALLLRGKCYSEMDSFRDSISDYETALTIERTANIERALEEAKTALEKQSEKKDYYKILGIAQNATDDEIKKAYRKQALLHHPDKHASASRETKYRQEMKFKMIGEANAVLSDPQKRRQFDYSLRKSSFV